ncbi:MAG: GNAT family N-acetyltransferase, partial [Candidatus Delongbacteria bacterium]|nr:GNAT family N-acetyltransferase [Candidatus Delongbacteria bacterium]
SLHYTYHIDLKDRTEEQIFQRMSDDRRNDIRKAVRDGLHTEPLTNPDVMYQLVCDTYSRQSKSIPTQLLHKILYQFARPENSFGYLTLNESAPCAAAFCIHDAHTAYYLLGGHYRENRHHGAGPLAVWECIKKSRDLGLSTFDFEGSMIQPIERYFRGFGGKLVSYYTINKAWLPLEILLKFKKREWF